MDSDRERQGAPEMIERLVQTRAISPSTDSWTAASAEPQSALPFSLYAVQLILAYEWLLSGVNKIVSSQFASQLPVMLHQSTLVNRYHWYSSLLEQLVLP